MFHTIPCVPKLLLAFYMAALFGCASTGIARTAPAQKPAAEIANPASENCIRHGGTQVILKRGDSGEYGACVFADNRQCEDWAMFRGECPIGGIKITGYLTQAARYCAITGGMYQVTGNGDTDKEQGTCTFKNGRTCDVWDYFAGRCNPDTDAGRSSYDDPSAHQRQ